jgi:hypothetical protein
MVENTIVVPIIPFNCDKDGIGIGGGFPVKASGARIYIQRNTCR